MSQPEHLTFTGDDPVAHQDRVLEIVTAPTGDAARFFAGTQGECSAWLERAEVEQAIAFLSAWLERTALHRP